MLLDLDTQLIDKTKAEIITALGTIDNRFSKLSLRFNEIGSISIELMPAFSAIPPSITTLDLSGNRFTKNKLMEIFNHLPHTINEITVDDIHDDRFFEVGRYLPYCMKLNINYKEDFINAKARTLITNKFVGQGIALVNDVLVSDCSIPNDLSPIILSYLKGTEQKPLREHIKTYDNRQQQIIYTFQLYLMIELAALGAISLLLGILTHAIFGLALFGAFIPGASYSEYRFYRKGGVVADITPPKTDLVIDIEEAPSL